MEIHLNTKERETTFCNTHLSELQPHSWTNNSLSHTHTHSLTVRWWDSKAEQTGRGSWFPGSDDLSSKGLLFPCDTWTDEDSNLQGLSLTPALPVVLYMHICGFTEVRMDWAMKWSAFWTCDYVHTGFFITLRQQVVPTGWGSMSKLKEVTPCKPDSNTPAHTSNLSAWVQPCCGGFFVQYSFKCLSKKTTLKKRKFY